MTESANLILQALFLVGFCAMIIDGTIDPQERAVHRELLMKTPMQEEEAYTMMANYHIEIINADTEGFMTGYFQALKENNPSPEEALMLLHVINQVIQADDEVTPKEEAFLNLTRMQLGISQEDGDKSLAQSNASDWREEPEGLHSEVISDFVEALNLPEFDSIKE